MFFWGKDKTMIAKHSLRAIHEIGLMAGISIILTANANGQSIHPPIGTPLSDPPQVVTSFELQAINDPATGKGAFVLKDIEFLPLYGRCLAERFDWNMSTRCPRVLPRSAWMAPA
jgi:hypothetical protein